MLQCSQNSPSYYAQEHELLSGYYAIHEQFCMNKSLHVVDSLIKTVLLEYINEWYRRFVNRYAHDQSNINCSIRVYRSFTTIFHKCLTLLLIPILQFPIMLALWLMCSMTHYAQNYAA